MHTRLNPAGPFVCIFAEAVLWTRDWGRSRENRVPGTSRIGAGRKIGADSAFYSDIGFIAGSGGWADATLPNEWVRPRDVSFVAWLYRTWSLFQTAPGRTGGDATGGYTNKIWSFWCGVRNARTAGYRVDFTRIRVWSCRRA